MKTLRPREVSRFAHGSLDGKDRRRTHSLLLLVEITTYMSGGLFAVTFLMSMCACGRGGWRGWRATHFPSSAQTREGNPLDVKPILCGSLVLLHWGKDHRRGRCGRSWFLCVLEHSLHLTIYSCCFFFRQDNIYCVILVTQFTSSKNRVEIKDLSTNNVPGAQWQLPLHCFRRI